MAKLAKELIALRLKPETVRWIKDEANRQGKTQADVVSDAIEVVRNPIGEPPESVYKAIGGVVVREDAPRGFPIICRHCGEVGAHGSTKIATICFDCKAGGHSNEPRDCPVCTEQGTGAL